MATALGIMDHPWVFSLGWVILHSFWQCALIAGCCALLLFLSRQYSANFRYLIALVCVFCCVLASSITFYRYMSSGVNIDIVVSSDSVLVGHVVFPARFDLTRFLDQYIHVLVFLWLAGFCICTLKTLLAYRYCHQLKTTGVSTVSEQWQCVFDRLCQRIGITKPVVFRLSEVAPFPCVIGHLKPMVIIPSCLLLRMSPMQLEAVVLHELGHVRRNDYAFALAQAICKTLMFFNPFFLWISSQMDKEREHACDDIAVSINQDPLLFANTLKEFADMNNNFKPALGIQGDKLLLNRITRLFNRPPKTAGIKSSLLAAVLIISTGGVASLYVNAHADNSTSQHEALLENKQISFTADNLPLVEVMAEVNNLCGASAAVAEEQSSELVTLHVEDEACSKIISLLQSYR